MFRLNILSKQRLLTCDVQLQALVCEVIKHRDCCVLAGYLGRSEYHYATKDLIGALQFPNSPHNTKKKGKMCSRAVHILPRENKKIITGDLIDDQTKIYIFAGFVLGVASQMEIPLIWDGEIKAHTFLSNCRELSHYELAEEASE